MIRRVVSPLPLRLKVPFRIAHGASSVRDNLLLELREESTAHLTGLGEAACVFYYGDTVDSLRAALLSLPDPFPDFAHPSEALARLAPDFPAAARAALDIAAHDLWAKRRELPLHAALGLAAPPNRPSAVTVALDTPAAMAAQARALRTAPILKIKLDGDAPLARFDAVRDAVDSALWVDANGSWTVDQTIAWAPHLFRGGAQLLEQPLSSESPPDEWRRLRDGLRARGCALPLYADESIRSVSALETFADALDGIVVKVMKSGGLTGACTLIAAARARGLKVLLSCMIESSLGIAAALHLAALCDQLDLDGHLLLNHDPFGGLACDNFRPRLEALLPGIGVTRVQPE